MNKNELIEAIAEKSELSRVAAGRALSATIEAITQALGKGDSVTLVGFGSFLISQRKARDGHNPQTGEVMKIPAMRVPRFRPGKLLKDAVK